MCLLAQLDQFCHQIRHVIYHLKSQEHLNKFLSGILKANTYFTIYTNSINFGVGAHTDTLLASNTYRQNMANI